MIEGQWPKKADLLWNKGVNFHLFVHEAMIDSRDKLLKKDLKMLDLSNEHRGSEVSTDFGA